MVDTVIAAPFAFVALALASDVLDGYDRESMEGDYYHDLQTTALIISLVPAVIFGSSAATGYVRTTRCRRAPQAQP